MRVTILQTYLYIIVDIVYYKNMCDHVYTCIGIKLQIHIPSGSQTWQRSGDFPLQCLITQGW